MALRELLHDRLDMLAIFSPVAPEVIAALPAAVEAHFGSIVGEELHRSSGRGQRWARASGATVGRLLPFVVKTVPAGLSSGAQAIRSVEDGYPGLPLSITVSSDQVTMMFPHDLFDGTAAWRHMAAIAALATGAPVSETENPRVKFPVFSALRHSDLLSREALSAARSARRQAEESTVAVDQRPEGFTIDTDRRHAGFTSILISAEQLASIESTVSPAQANSDTPTARATGSMKSAEVVLAAAADSFDPKYDYRVRMSVDLRRYAPRKTTVLGPFSTAFPLGMLRASDNTAPALSARLASSLSSKAPLAALVGDLVGLVRLRVRHPIGAPVGDAVRTSIDLGISILPSQLPETFWGEGERRSGAILVHPTQATNPYIQLSRIGDELAIGIWDEIGAIDIPAFEASLSASIASRVSTSQTKENQP